jgi:prolyl oligopeptidase
VSTDFGAGSLTTSGYPRVAKLWHRGTPLTAAHTLFQGDTTDVSVGVGAVEMGDSIIGLVVHAPTFFESTSYVLRGDSLAKLALPLDADPSFLGDQLVVYLRSPWSIGKDSFPGGAIVSTTIADFLGGGHDFTLVLAPSSRQTVDGMSTTRDYLLVHLLDNVRSRLLRYERAPAATGWKVDTLPVPDLGSVGGITTSPATNRFFFEYSAFTQPTTQYLADEDGSVRELKRLPAQFDASGLVTEQFEATSKDGTRVPYFVVHREHVNLDGTNPTLLYGYGGFEISLLSSYGPLTGAAWLERGGVYVLANIRGGGEFGPTWHRAAMKEHRQRAYDDFIAVAQDLIARRITSPAHLGIEGGSNGGLLMGVMLTQRPDLWNAVAILNPLLDMQRYNHLLAGASWMGEYGDPDKPADWGFIGKYSPYQHLRSGVHYPRPFIATTTRDDRVHPGHARKFAAKLEAMGHQVYFFENTEGGHGAGVTSEQQARERALMFTYFWRQLGSETAPATP